MKLTRNDFKRFDIEGIPDQGVQKNGKIIKRGIHGYHGWVEKIVGWILNLPLFKKTVAIHLDQETYYLNCKSIEKLLTRVDPETYAKDAHLSRNTQDANWVVKALDTLVQVLKDKDKKDQEIQFKENNQVIVTEPDLKKNLESQALEHKPDEQQEQIGNQEVNLEIIKETKLDEPTINPNAELESARNELLEWFRKDGSKLGEGEYEQVAAKAKQLSQGLPRVDMTLHFDSFRFGQDLYYGEIQGEQKFIPIFVNEGIILKWQANNGGSWWPIKDPRNNTYFVPNININVVKGTHSGSESTGSYLSELLSNAKYDPKAYRILEGLTSYAEFIQQELGNSPYLELRRLIPDYPDLPKLPERQFSFFI